MRTRLLSFVASGTLLLGASVYGQQRPTSNSFRSFAAPRANLGGNEFTTQSSGNHGVDAESVLSNNPLPQSVSIAGAVPIGIFTKFPNQTNRGSLHNIQVDPSNPNRIHAVVMSAPNVTAADTIGGNYPNRNCYYTFSADGGATWSTPKAISTIRGGFPDMVLYKRGENYVPIIGAHRYLSASSKDFVCALYVEKGDPGAGNFEETLADRNATVTSGQRDILWPTIAISPDNQTVYMAASLNTTTTDQNFYPLEFGTFTLDAAGKATWNGWKSGPNGPSGTEGLTSGGEYVLRVSTSGKLGLAWDNYDFDDQDLGLYFAESADGGATWVSNWQPIWHPTDINTQASDGSNMFLRPANGLDMFYDGETVRLITGMDFDQLLSSGDQFIPASGGLMFWNGDTTSVPQIVLSKFFSNAADTGAFLSTWAGLSSGVDPQGLANVLYPTIGRSSISGKWSIFYQVWANGDVEVLDTANNIAFPFMSIYEEHTGDDGASWSTPNPILTNTDQTVQKLDYRFPDVSSWNPTNAGNIDYKLLFAADTAAGQLNNGGDPTWDDLGYYYYTFGTAGVSRAVPTSFTLAQNYPNPFNPSTTISYNLAKSSNVVLTVTDILGRTVATIVNKVVAAGPHSLKFDASNLATGVYSYTLKANGEVFSQRMVLAK